MKGNFKKYLTVFVLLLTMISATGCNVNNQKKLSDVEMQMQQVVEFNNMEKGNSKDLKRYYKLNAKDYEEVLLYKPQSTMDVTELLIVKVKDDSQIESLEDSIDSRLNYQLQSFSGYGPEQCGLLNNYELKVKGNFVFFAVSEKAEEIKEAFLDSIKN